MGNRDKRINFVTMKTVIIGSGNVAEAMAKAVAESANELVAILARNRERGEMIAEMCGCRHVEIGVELPTADLYIISISDRAVEELAKELVFPAEAIVAHTAGGVSIDALGTIKNRAVLYPLQTFTKGRKIEFGRIPLFLEYTNQETGEKLKAFAQTLSDSVYEADSTLRSKMHVAAVFACNFVNRMYGIGYELLSKESLPFDILKPLIEETCAKALDSKNPASVQTGPAVRNDQNTMQKHLQYIEDDDTKTEIYKLISKDIWETSKKI